MIQRYVEGNTAGLRTNSNHSKMPRLQFGLEHGCLTLESRNFCFAEGTGDESITAQDLMVSKKVGPDMLNGLTP